MNRRASLTEQLRGFRAADARESAYCERMQELLDLPGDPLSGEHYEPGHFTASAFVLSPSRTELLLIHHRKLGLWLQPGGHVEAHDPSVLHAARREVLEEVGIAELTLERDEPFDLDVHTIPARDIVPRHEHFDVRFLFTAASRAFAASDEVLSARWTPLAEIEGSGTDESVLRAVRKLHTLGLARL
jgi:8-oxo-dGTP pyrophosphatase MutT (NUDIX family)